MSVKGWRVVEASEKIKQFYAEEVCVAAALPEGQLTERIMKAFATVPREKHVGSGPWLLQSPLRRVRRRTPDSDPKRLYHNVLIALDEERGINIGQPSLWAQLFLTASVTGGDNILQIGAGSGYFTAILSELVGPEGFVTATEIEPALVSMAQNALEGRSNVAVEHKNAATECTGDEGPFDLIIAFAGVTHPLPSWRNLLKPNGRMLLPITGAKGQGAMMLFKQIDGSFHGTTVGRCGFYPCSGARHPDTAADLDVLWSDASLLKGARFTLHMEQDRAIYEHVTI